VRDHELGVAAVDGVTEALPGALAEHRVPAEAVPARAAARSVQVHDAVARRDRRDRRPDARDHAGEFVTEHRWKLHPGKAAPPVDEVPPAHRRGVHAHEHLVGPGGRIRNLLEHELLGASGLAKHDRAHQVDVRSFLRRAARSIARSTRRVTSSRGGMPLASQSFGYIEIAVKPGMVLISFT